jgi:hypothetical protein
MKSKKRRAQVSAAMEKRMSPIMAWRFKPSMINRRERLRIRGILRAIID